MATLDWGAAVDSQEKTLTSEMNRITLDKNRSPSKPSPTAALGGPAQTSHPSGPPQTSPPSSRPADGGGAMAAGSSPNQDGSGDNEEKGTSKEDASLLQKLINSKLLSTKADLEILQKDPNSPLYSVKSFEALNLKKELLDGIYQIGYNTPSKIQETALPVLLADPPVNMIAQSQSGTGKTAAFVLTMLSRVDTRLHYPQCLCIAPTYELALQIGKNVEDMGKCMTDLKIIYAVRGKKLDRGTKLDGHLIIGTPGTVCDWALKLRFFDLKKINVFVLDEADVMIAKQGHQDQSIRIQRGLRKDCQMLLFSATYEDDVMKFAQAVIPNNPIVIRLRREEQSLDNIKQYYIKCADQEGKFQALSNIYGSISIGQSMIFCATRRTAAWLAEKMTKEGHAVGLLSGELSIEQRAAIINRFKDAKEKVLITTNVTARDIDVEQVTVVVNFDLPLTQDFRPDFETYLHRIGRTGRFGKKGLAINMVDGRQAFSTLKQIEKYFVSSVMTQSTSSSLWREQGNGIYVTARDDLCPSIRKDRLRQAANCYYKAFNFSVTDDEKISAAKNLAMVSWKTAKVDEHCLERMPLMIHQYKEAFKHFSYGFHHSVNIKPETWRDGLYASAKSCWDELRAGRVSELTIENRVHIYHDLVQHMQIPEIQAECYIELANNHFHCGITAIQNKDFKKGLYEMRDCYMPINEAKRCQEERINIQAEIRILEEDVFMHQCMAESMQAISIGDDLYGKLLLDEESLNMDLVYDIMDWYKQAVVRTREITEVELEAIALSRLGRVYDRVLKIKYKTKEYLMRSMQLAHSMHPRTFTTEEWFKDCAEILERYQKETVAAEEEKWNKEREEIIKGLEKEMKKINTADEKDSQEFLRYIYKVFPPKNTEHKLEDGVKKEGTSVDRCVLKKTLQKAVIHYHPDKVDAEKHGKEWKVLSEEITKRLTKRYECMK